jgi:aspartokinase/homoserine dehydrogenase 1
MEMDVIENIFLKNVWKPKAMKNFSHRLLSMLPHFENVLADAKSKDCRLKFVVSLITESISVGLQLIPKR